MELKKDYESKDASLESMRAEIDECDRQIIQLLDRRFELVRKIGVYKAIHNLPVLDEARETELLSDKKRQASVAGHYSVEDIFKPILEQSRQIQAKVGENISLDKLDEADS